MYCHSCSTANAELAREQQRSNVVTGERLVVSCTRLPFSSIDGYFPLGTSRGLGLLASKRTVTSNWCVHEDLTSSVSGYGIGRKSNWQVGGTLPTEVWPETVGARIVPQLNISRPRMQQVVLHSRCEVKRPRVYCESPLPNLTRDCCVFTVMNTGRGTPCWMWGRAGRRLSTTCRSSSSGAGPTIR